MRKKQYNNIIEHTLKHAKTDDSLETARAIFKNMGVALPQGDIKEVSDILKTNSYMGWRACDATEAQKAADSGIAAIGIDEEKIIVLSANDEEQPVEQTASVMTFSEYNELDSENSISLYSYIAMRTTGNQYGRTWGSLEEAMNYYGTDFTYTYCGGYYNYYYTFSDGSRLYFRVA